MCLHTRLSFYSDYRTLYDFEQIMVTKQNEFYYMSFHNRVEYFSVLISVQFEAISQYVNTHIYIPDIAYMTVR